MEPKVSVESSVAQTGTVGLAMSRQIAMIRAKEAQGKMTQLTGKRPSKARQAIAITVVTITKL